MYSYKPFETATKQQIPSISRRDILLKGGAMVVLSGMGIKSSFATVTIDVQEALSPRILGNAEAPVTLIEYASLTCGYCAKFHKDILPELQKNYIDTGIAKLDFRDFPLDRNALVAEVLLRCLPKERYFKALDVLYAKQQQWSSSNDPVKALKSLLRLAGLSEEKAEAGLANEALVNGVIESRMTGTKEYDVRGTPTVIIGKTTLRGVRPLKEYTKAIEKLAP